MWISQVNLKEKTAELDQDQAGSDPGETYESRPPSEQVFIDEDHAGPDPRESGVALAGPVRIKKKDSQNRYLYEEDPPGQVTIQSQFFFNKDLEYLVPGDKGKRSALSISKLKAAKYLDFGLEELVPTLWIESEREYDISVAYGISHWWFKRKEFYITRYSAPSDRGTVRSHMRVVSVVSLKTYERYSNMKHDMESYPELLKITWSVSLDPVE
ncbi:hypothetical protein Tco_1504752 [Tanacetum coccineum]